MPKRYVIALLVAAIGAAIIAGYFAGRPGETPPGHPPVPANPQAAVAEELYLQTLEDIEAKNFASAGVKLGRVDRAWKGNEQDEKMVRKVKEDLYQKATDAIQAKKWTEAKGPLDTLFIADPDFKDVRKKRKQVLKVVGADEGELAASSAGVVGGNRVAGALPPGAKGLPYEKPKEGPAKDIPANAKALDLVTKGLPGFKTVQRGLLQGDPDRAGGTYLPTDPKTKATVNRIITTVVRTTDALKAGDELKAHKGTYPKDRGEITVNRHDAYFGIYEIGDPKIFPPLATVTWTRGQWFFAVDVVPKAGAKVDDKREAGLFAARAWGY